MISVFQRHHPRLVPLALASVLVLGACGSGDDTAGDTVPPPIDASDGGLLAPRPVRTAGGGAGVAATSAVAEGAADRMSTDMMMPYRIVTFVAGDGLAALPSNDIGYLFDRFVNLMQERR